MIDDTVEDIREMRSHSSSVVAVTAAEALTELAGREYSSVDEFVRDLERNSSALRRANPSHASLFTAQHAIVDAVEEADPETVEAAKEALSAAIERVVDGIETAKREAAKNAADLLSDGSTVLIHDYSTTVFKAIEHALATGARLEVYATEARPRYLGRRTARTLAMMEGVDVHLIVDGAAGHYLPECDRVLVGMDCIVDEHLFNRVGTFPIAATAREVGVPMTVVGSSAKVIEEGFVFENDYRSSIEVMGEPPEGFDVKNPAYDATPLRLIDSIVTDDGVDEL